MSDIPSVVVRENEGEVVSANAGVEDVFELFPLSF